MNLNHFKTKYMRDIKFRGKQKNGSEWLYGDLNHINGLVYIFPRTDDTPFHSSDWFEVDPATVGQFTGVRDLKGNEIYENDVVLIHEHRANNPLNFIVRFNEECAFSLQWVVRFVGKESCFYDKAICPNKYKRFEIIGNTTDSPELLKPLN